MLLSGLQALAHDSATKLAAIEMAGAVFFGVVFVRHELRRIAPLLPFDLLKIRLFSLSLATSVASFMAQTLALVALPFEIQRIGHSVVETGLLMTPVAGRHGVRSAACRPLGRPLSVSPGRPRAPVARNGNCTHCAAFPPGGHARRHSRGAMALCGVGFGFFQSPNNRALLSSAPRARSGAAGGMLSTARLLGQSLGAACVAIVFRAYPGWGSNIVLWVAAGVALAAAAISLLRLSSEAPVLH